MPASAFFGRLFFSSGWYRAKFKDLAAQKCTCTLQMQLTYLYVRASLVAEFAVEFIYSSIWNDMHSATK